jgi:hypothetical protein
MQGVPTDGTDQHNVIEGNYLHDLPTIDDSAIAIVNSWGTPNGVTIRNNIIDTVTSGEGIRIYGTQAIGVRLYNNTIYNASSLCITSQGTSIVELRNNVCLDNNGVGAQVTLAGTITSTNNAYSGTWSASCTNCVSGITTGAVTNAAGGVFTLVGGSPLIDVGLNLGVPYSDDYLSLSRPQGSGWDIGAYEFDQGGAGPAPDPPAGGSFLSSQRPAVFSRSASLARPLR